MKRALVIDPGLCFDCKACEVACKQEHQLPTGPKRIQVVTIGPRWVGGRLTVDFVPRACLHCGAPPCVESCPTDALVKREDGIVVVENDRCIGCELCLPACPFDAIQFNPETKLIEKCDLCVSRVDQGLRPACVHHCEAGALFFGEVNEIAGQLRTERTLRKGRACVYRC
jgi:tetrathionate reductase subunit B